MVRALVAIAAVLVSLTARAASDSPEWRFERVDRTGSGNRQNPLRVAPNGAVHLAYTGCSDPKCRSNELFYAERDALTNQWKTTSLDAESYNTGWFPSLELGPDGSIYIAYGSHFRNDSLKGDLLHFHSKKPAAAWAKQKIGTMPSGYWVSTAMKNGRIFLSNTSFPTGTFKDPALQFGVFEGASWTFTQLDSGPDTGWYTSLALDPSGHPWISYITGDYFGGKLKLQHQTSSGLWEAIPLDSGVTKSSLAIDSHGYVHIAYTKADPAHTDRFDLAYVTSSPDGQWHYSLVDGAQSSRSDTGYHPHLSIDSNDGLHVTYTDNGDYHLKYARNLGKGWEIRSVTKPGNPCFYSWTEVDSRGDLHLACDRGEELWYGVCAGCAAH